MSEHNSATFADDPASMNHQETSRRLSDIIERAHSIVFFGGAGVSTESGIPDFRSETGLYSTASGAYPPEYMLSRSCFDQHTKEFFDFYREKMIYPEAQPNDAHKALAFLEKQGKLSAVITQNIDGLHQEAGSHNVIELHGSVHRNYCMECSAAYPLSLIQNSSGVPRCEKCGGIVKPDVVLYEEPLNESNISAAVKALAHADVLIIGGTSLNVYPAAGLVQYFAGSTLVLINKGETAAHVGADLTIREPIGVALRPFIAPAEEDSSKCARASEVVDASCGEETCVEESAAENERDAENGGEEKHSLETCASEKSSDEHPVTVAVNIDGENVGGGLGRATAMAVAEVCRGVISAWTVYGVGWDALHGQGSHGAHHARIARFMREHHVDIVVTGHAGAPMLAMMAKLGVAVALGAHGSAREAACVAVREYAQKIAQE